MWQSRPLFISSTFQDMQVERDYLRTIVFPHLEERLRARRHNLEWVDLRVGVATASVQDEHVRESHVLKVCLEEVRRCRPFLIVLLGDRYGYVPPEDRIRAAAEEAREGFSADVAGRSVTDLEIDFGVLSDPEQQPRSIFYFRDPLPYAEMPPENAKLYSDAYDTDLAAADRADRVGRLATLKSRIEQQVPDRVRHYAVQWDAQQQCVTGLKDWGEKVLEDIWSELEAETRSSAAQADITWQEAERQALADFVDDRARDFVGRQDVLKRLIDFAIGPDNVGTAWGTCVTGDPGSGKSALFGELYRRLGDSDVFLLAHAAGANVAAASVDLMLHCWISELAETLGSDPGLAEDADPDTIDAAFALLLGEMAQRRRVVMLIDALDQFEATTRAQYITWLPQLWPANARFLAMAVAGNASQALANRAGIELVHLPPLGVAEARDIAEGVCRRYHRTFEPELIEALLAKNGSEGSAWGNPLWLVLAVEELNLLDADDFARAQRAYAGEPAERLRALMLDMIASFPVDIPGLYAHTFERFEQLFGASITRGFLGLIAVGRAGWRESDFRILLPLASGEKWNELKFAQLRRLFRGQLRRRGALECWDFNHAQMRAAVHALLAAVGVAARTLHAIVADRLLSCPPDDPLHISETVVHLLGSEDYDRAAGYYGDDALSEAELKGATRALADAVIAPPTGVPATAAQHVCHLLGTPNERVRAFVAKRFLLNLSDAIEQRAPLDACFIVFTAIKRTIEGLLDLDPGNTDRQHDLSVSCNRVGEVTRAQGHLSLALESFRDGFAIIDRLARIDPGNADWQRDLALSHNAIGDVLGDQSKLNESVKSHIDALTITERLANAEPDNAQRQHVYALAVVNIAGHFFEKGEVQEAVRGLSAATAILEKVANAQPDNSRYQTDLAVFYDKVGSVHASEHDYAAALNAFRSSLSIKDRLAKSDPGNAGWQYDLMASHRRVGEMQSRQHDSAGALKSYRDSLAIADRLARFDPGNVAWQIGLRIAHDCVGDALLAEHNVVAALNSFREGMAVLQRLAAAHSDDVRWQDDLARSYDNLADVLKTHGDLPGALEYLNNSLAIKAARAKAESANPVRQRDLAMCHREIGDILLEQRRLPDALNSLRESQGIFERLAKAEDDEARLQYDWAMSCSRIGYVLVAQGELAGALTSYREGHAISDRLAQGQPENLALQHNLSISYFNIADVLAAQGELEEALKPLHEGVVIAERLANADPGNADWQRDLATAYGILGFAYWKAGQLSSARSAYEAAVTVAARLVMQYPDWSLAKEDLAKFQSLKDELERQLNRV